MRWNRRERDPARGSRAGSLGPVRVWATMSRPAGFAEVGPLPAVSLFGAQIHARRPPDSCPATAPVLIVGLGSRDPPASEVFPVPPTPYDHGPPPPRRPDPPARDREGSRPGRPVPAGRPGSALHPPIREHRSRRPFNAAVRVPPPLSVVSWLPWRRHATGGPCHRRHHRPGKRF
jgi:hypothetical protein